MTSVDTAEESMGIVFLGRGVGVWPPPLRPLARAICRVEEKWFWYGVNASYARLRRDPVAWAEELEERRLWDRTLMDGLEDEPPWPPEDIEDKTERGNSG